MESFLACIAYYGIQDDSTPTLVQKRIRHQHYATTEIYVEEVQKPLKGMEEAVTQALPEHHH